MQPPLPHTPQQPSDAPTGTVCFDVDGLTLAYDGKPALAGVTLPIYRGRILAVLGPSGSGKTSFLGCLNRLVDLIPTARISGRVVLDGADILDRNVDLVALRRRVGMIFQKPNPFPLSIYRNLAMPLKEHGLRRRDEIDEAVRRALGDVGLWDEVKDRLHRSALLLSGGQQQRLCLARALVLRPEVLLLDEPCSALDPIAMEVIEELIARLRGRLTIVVVTHNLAQARRLADDAALFWLEQGVGRLIEHGPAAGIFNNPSHPQTEAYVTGRQG